MAGAEYVSRKLAGNVGRKISGEDVSSLLGYREEFDIDSEIREQRRVLDREIISSDFYFNRLPLAAVLKID